MKLEDNFFLGMVHNSSVSEIKYSNFDMPKAGSSSMVFTSKGCLGTALDSSSGTGS